MNFSDLIDPQKIKERQKEVERMQLENAPTQEQVQQQNRKRQKLLAARKKGKLILGIVCEETRPHYNVAYFDANGKKYTGKDLEKAGIQCENR